MIEQTTTTNAPALSNMEGLTSPRPVPLWAMRLEVRAVSGFSVVGNQWPSAQRNVLFQADAADTYAPVQLTPFDGDDW